MIRHRFLAAGWLALLSCSPEEPPPPKPEEPPPELLSLGEVPFPEWEEIDDEEFKELNRPRPEEPLRWDFSGGRRYNYVFTQRISQVITHVKGEERGRITTRDRNRGVFEFVAGRERTALALIRIRTEEVTLNGQDQPPEVIKKAPPNKFQCVVQESGKAEVRGDKKRADADFFFDALLPLATGDRKVRDGSVNTSIAGVRKVGRFECARLETEFEFAPVTGSGRSLLRGRTISYFALAEGHFVRVRTTVVAGISTRVKERDGTWSRRLLRSDTSQMLVYQDDR